MPQIPHTPRYRLSELFLFCVLRTVTIEDPPDNHRSETILIVCGNLTDSVESMTSIYLSSAVMTHPRRLADAEKLATTLGLDATVLDPSPDAHPSTLRTALAAWAATIPGATHHLVVQDDVSAPASLRDLVRRSVVRHQTDPLAFYAHWNSRNGAMVRLAALAGASWVRAVPEEYTPTQAICLPVAVAEEFRQYASDNLERPDDEVLSAFLRETGRIALLAVPNLVEHIGEDSIAGNEAYGIRRSACCVASPDVGSRLCSGWLLDEVDYLPYMRHGEAHLRVDVPSGDTRNRDHVVWRDALLRTGLIEEQVLNQVKKYRSADTDSATARLFGRRYANELWIYCLLLGWQAERLIRRYAPITRARPTVDYLDRKIRETAVSTIGISSLAPDDRMALSAEHAEIINKYVVTGIKSGRIIQSH